MWKRLKKTTEALKDIKDEEFQNCFENWKKNIEKKCIVSNGECFKNVLKNVFHFKCNCENCYSYYFCVIRCIFN